MNLAGRLPSPLLAVLSCVVFADLVLWLADRGVTRPGEVTKPMLDRYDGQAPPAEVADDEAVQAHAIALGPIRIA